MEPVPLRLKVLVRGASMALNVGPARKSLAQGTFPEMLERRLRAAGVDAFVTTRARAWDSIKDVFPEYYYLLAEMVPDVVVINFGEVEGQPRLMPRRLIGWFNRRRAIQPLGPVGGFVARVFDRTMRRLIARILRYGSKALGMRTNRMKPERFQAELERLITWTRGKTRGLVLVMTLNPAPPGIETLWAHLDARYRHYSELTAEVVRKIADPEVRLIDVQTLIRAMGPKEALYDGLHYVPEASDAVAKLMADQVLDWLETAER